MSVKAVAAGSMHRRLFKSVNSMLDNKICVKCSSYRRSAAHASNTSGASTGSGGGPMHTSMPLGRLLTHTLARLRAQIPDLGWE